MSVVEMINTIRSILSVRVQATSNVTLWYGDKKVFADNIKITDTGIHVSLTEFK